MYQNVKITKNAVVWIVLAVIVLAALLGTGAPVCYCAGLVPLLFVYTLYAAASKECGVMEVFCRSTKKELFLFTAVTFLYVMCVYGMIVREDFVYFWDNGAYWYTALDIQNSLFSDFVTTLVNMYHSVNTQEYNQFLAGIIAIPLKLLGNSYITFVLLVTMLFLVPALILISAFIWQIKKQYGMQGLSFFNIYFVVLSITVPLFPVLSGYIDAAALIPLVLCYMLTIKIEYDKTVEWKKSGLIGILLVIVLIMRRYYGYAVVAYVLFLFGYVLLKNGIKNWKFGLKYKAANIMVTGFTSLFILLLFFGDFALHSLFNNHQVSYAAYNVHGYAEKWKIFCLYFGLAVIFFAVCAVLCAVKQRLLLFSLPMLLSLAAAMMLFFHIQDFGEHHYYITVIPVITLAVLGYESLYRFVEKSKYKAAAVLLSAFLAGVCALNFGFSIGIFPGLSNQPLLTSRTYVPKVRYDTNTLRQMDQELALLDGKGYKGVYVVASSGVLNDEILRKLNAPNMQKGYQLYGASHVDLRDGFYTDFLDADVIIDCNPLQIHLPLSGQAVISLLHDAMQEESAFQKKYKLFSTYILDGGTEANIYIKQKELEKTDVQYIRDLFVKKYHAFPELFQDRFDAYIRAHFGQAES